MDAFRLSIVDEGMILTPKKFIEETNAIGLKSARGRYGGTYAHKDVAIAFCYWLSPVFQVYFVKEFERLKTIKQANETQDWAIEKLLNANYESALLLQTLQD